MPSTKNLQVDITIVHYILCDSFKYFNNESDVYVPTIDIGCVLYKIVNKSRI